MATQIIIRNLAPDVVDSLALKAAQAGQSLQGYMANLATNAAATLSTSEMVTRASDRVQKQIGRRPTRQEILEVLAQPR
jgi:plasmid stability protein